MTFARIQAERFARGLTQTALAEKLKMKQEYIAQLETAKTRNPTLQMLRRLAKALKVTVAELVK